MTRKLLPALILILLSGCTLAKVDVTVQSERTTLENQVLGTYNSLSEEALLVASVRGVDPLGQIQQPEKKSPALQRVQEAIQIRAFHADDIQNFKQLGWVGENNQGLLTGFEMQKEDLPAELEEFASRYDRDEFDTVLQEVNNARETIMKQIIHSNEHFSEDDLPRIRSVFAKLNREKALPGEKIQTEDGTWQQAM